MRTRMINGKGLSNSNKGRFYRKSLIMLLIVTSIPGLITGVLVYWIAGDRLERELLQLHKNQIEQRALNIDEQLANIELMLSHWAFDSQFDYSLKDRDFIKDFERTRDITKTMLVMQGSSTMIERVELYVEGQQQPILFNPEYEVLDAKPILNIYKGLLDSPQTTYWTRWTFDPKRPTNKELTFVHHIPGGSLQPFGTLLIRLNNEKVGNMLRTMTPYNEGETFLVCSTGELFATAEGVGTESPFVSVVMDKIRALGSPKGSFLFDWNDVTYTVSYGQFSRISDDWTYVSASPITSITSLVVLISKIIFSVSLSALLLAALLAWVASHRIYSPVNRLMHLLFAQNAYSEEQDDEFTFIEQHWQHLSRESNELHSKLSDQLPYVKESFLLQLLQGHLYAYSEEDLHRRMERYKWEVSNRCFIVLYVQLTGITSLEGRFRYGDEGLLTFVAVNMIEELASQHFDQSDTVNFHDLAAGVLLLVPNDHCYMQETQIFCEELMHTIHRILKMRVTIAISRAVHHISDIPIAFESVKQAASYRNVDNENQIIDMEYLSTEGDEPQYPFTLEKELVQALRTGKEDEATQFLAEFLGALTSKGAKEIDVQQGMLHLLGNVQHAIMVSGIQPNRLFKGANMYEQLSQIREQKLILSWFEEKVIAPFLKELAGRSNAQVKGMIEQSMIYLQQQYMNDISLDHCAEMMGTNSFFLSRSFKQVTGKNFIDYLTEIRMDKAKQLLRESELKINNVAEQVGYQHSYFNRIFKKTEGMTPSQYRELSRS